MNTQPTQNQPGEVPIHKKHLGFFWPLVTILITASVVAGAVVWFSHESVLSDEISSMVIKIHKDVNQNNDKAKEINIEKSTK